MLSCVYCNENEGEVTFLSREHVIPKLMGTFENNLTLTGLVCDNCNSKIFNVLETRFKEDTEEGLFYQMLNFEKSPEIRIKANNIKTTFYSGLGADFFNEVFPFLKREDNKWKISILPQIKVKRYGNCGYLVLLIDELMKLSEKKFSKIKNFLKGVKSKDISIFTGGNGLDDDVSMQKAIALVKQLGIDYKEGQREFAPIDSSDKGKQFEISMKCTVGRDAGRIISKIAFNYFAYCAFKEKRTDILFCPEFSKIKDYIIGSVDMPIKEVIRAVENEPIIFDEKAMDIRYIGHIVTFYEENGYLISRISFLGKRVYTVILGVIPKDLNKINFGCGHLFDPMNKKIFGLTQNPEKRGMGQEIGFGLFNRI